MKIVQLNVVCGKGSTGNICLEISNLLDMNGMENYICYTSGRCKATKTIKYSSRFHKFEAVKSRLLGNYGFNSIHTTKKLISELERISPDVVHLHNMHGHNCNLDVLMDYFRQKQTPLVWTFHDCWAFTAYCPHYTMVCCEQWKTGCKKCPQIRKFSWLFDRSEWLYNKKKQALCGLNLTIVTPSQWLADQVKMSFLKDYPVKVINNGIDMSVFHPISSDFRKKHNISDDQVMILGVADQWVPRKGPDVFVELSKRLDPTRYRIVMVGTDVNIDKLLPENIISIRRTNNQTELAEIYSAADIFVNPTREEVLGLVNIESLACGTPVVSFNSGGSPECINSTSGCVVEKDDIDQLEREIERICSEHPYSAEQCFASASRFDQRVKYIEYLTLYTDILDRTTSV